MLKCIMQYYYDEHNESSTYVIQLIKYLFEFNGVSIYLLIYVLPWGGEVHPYRFVTVNNNKPRCRILSVRTTIKN